MKSLEDILRSTIDWQARLISWNPILGAAYLVFASVVLVFWLPAQLHNLTGLPIAVTIPGMFFLHAIQLFAVFRKVRF